MHYIKKTHILALVILLGFIILLLPGQDASRNSQPETGADTSLFKVSVLDMHQSPEPLFLSLFGYTEPVFSVSLKTRISGTLEKTPMDEGIVVEKGDLLAQISEENHKKKLKSAQAAYDLLKFEAHNAKILRKEGVWSEVATLKAASELKRAEAKLHQSKLDVQYLDIRAPVKGVFSQYALNEGAYVEKGDAVVQSIDVLNPLVIVAYVSQFDRPKIHVGQPTKVLFSDGDTINGTVTFLSSSADPKTRTYKVQVEVENLDYKYKAGLSVTLKFIYDYLPIYKLPTQALSLSDAGDLGVKVIGEDDRVIYKPVDLLYSNDNFFYVKGLSENERLIVDGHAFVVPGEKVLPVAMDHIQ